MAVLRGNPVQEGLYGSRAARETLRRALAAASWDLVIVQMVRCAWAVDVIRQVAPSLPLLFDAIDAMGLHYAHSLPSFPVLLRPLVAAESRRCRRRERWLASQAALTTAVAPRDLAALGAPAERARVVPVAGRTPAPSSTEEQRDAVLLSGNLGYRPTVAGALWFAREVWPRVRQRSPGARWLLAGARPSGSILKLARLPGVEVHGDVEDMAPYFAQACIAIAPMSTGSGVPMKVLEAWAAGVPVMAREWAAAGLLGSEGLVVAEQPDEWIEMVVTLLDSEQRRRELARRGADAWQRWYAPQRVADEIRAAIAAAVSETS